METPAISSLVTPSLHPDVLIPHADVLASEGRENTVGYGAYHAAREVLAEVYQWHVGVEESDKALRELNEPQQRRYGHHYPTNQMRELLNEKGGAQELYDAAGTGMQKALSRTEPKVKTIANAINHLAREIDRGTEDASRLTPHGIALASEIRNHIKGLPVVAPGGGAPTGVSRFSFVHQAIMNGDKTTVAAVLKVPAFLSGLTDKEHQALRTEAEKTWAPVEYDQHQALTKIHESLETARADIIVRYGKLEQTLGRAAKARQQANKALSRLANGGK